MNDKPYNLAFTAGALLQFESIIMAQLYLDVQDWDEVKNQLQHDNLLQIRTASGAYRIFREVRNRLKHLSLAEMQLLVDSPLNEQKSILWLAICKHYRFIQEFGMEVLNSKYLLFDPFLTYEDFDKFFNRKLDWHPALENISDGTRKKLRSNLFRMLREADLIDSNNQINPVLLSPEFIQTTRQHSADFFNIYPVSPADIQIWAQTN